MVILLGSPKILTFLFLLPPTQPSFFFSFTKAALSHTTCIFIFLFLSSPFSNSARAKSENSDPPQGPLVIPCCGKQAHVGKKGAQVSGDEWWWGVREAGFGGWGVYRDILFRRTAYPTGIREEHTCACATSSEHAGPSITCDEAAVVPIRCVPALLRCQCICFLKNNF